MRPSTAPEAGVRVRTQLIVAGLLAALVLIGLPGVAQAGGIVLRLGSRGSAVVTLQRDLHIRADGVFGSQTRRAVLNFQRRHHLGADGVVGARTWRALGGAPRVAAPVHRAKPKPKPRPRPRPRPRPKARPRPRPAVRRPVVSLGARAVALAAAQRGKPYRWGAAGPYAFDCSGLVQWVYRRLGVNLPRTTYGQAGALRHVSHAAARPGDLIFVDRYQHVGIYIGLGAMWHAPHTGSTVRISPIWDRNFVVARVR